MRQNKETDRAFYEVLRTIAVLIGTLILCIVAGILTSGCTRTQYLPSETQTVTQYRYIERIDTVTVPVPIPAGSAFQVTADSASHLETDIARSDAWLDSLGRLHHTLDNKPGGIPVQIPVKTIQRDSVTCKTRRVTYTVERNLTTKQRIETYLSGTCAGITVFAIILAVSRHINSRRRKQS